jgi:putative zinc finger/helix-turn-helix YgiT family protein
MNKKIYCPMCEEDREARAQSVREEYEVRGEKITLDVPRLFCSTCGESVIDEAFGDPTLHLYDEYRRRHGLLSPERIRQIREKYGLSRESFAVVCGMSPATLYRYESGSLQDDVHDSLIFLCDDPATMDRLVHHRQAKLSELQRNRFERAFETHSHRSSH